MLYYCVTVTISAERHDEWFEWMRSVHIPDVLRTGLLLSSYMYRIVEPAPEHGVQYEIRYTCRNREDYDRYQAGHAPQLQAAHTEKFQGHFSASRRLLEALPDGEQTPSQPEKTSPAVDAATAEQ